MGTNSDFSVKEKLKHRGRKAVIRCERRIPHHPPGKQPFKAGLPICRSGEGGLGKPLALVRYREATGLGAISLPTQSSYNITIGSTDMRFLYHILHQKVF